MVGNPHVIRQVWAAEWLLKHNYIVRPKSSGGCAWSTITAAMKRNRKPCMQAIVKGPKTVEIASDLPWHVYLQLGGVGEA